MKWLVGIFVLLSTVGSGWVGASAQRTTRRIAAASAELCTPTTAADTVACRNGDIVLSGYEKPLRARRESLFATNLTPLDIEAIELEIVYLDMKGRQLHRRRLWVDADIPQGQTRKLGLPSWDTNCTFYFCRGDIPRKKATPYDVRIDALRAVAKPNPDKK